MLIQCLVCVCIVLLLWSLSSHLSPVCQASPKSPNLWVESYHMTQVPHFWCGVVSCLFSVPSSSSCSSRPQQTSTGWSFDSEWTIPLRNLAEPIWNSSSPLFFHGAGRLCRYYTEVPLHPFQGGNGAIHLQSRGTEINTGERKRMTKHRRKKKERCIEKHRGVKGEAEREAVTEWESQRGGERVVPTERWLLSEFIWAVASQVNPPEWE